MEIRDLGGPETRIAYSKIETAMLLKELINHIGKRPGMYGEDIFQIRSFLLGFMVGTAHGESSDEWGTEFHDKFGEFVDKKFSNRSTVKNWANLIADSGGDASFPQQVEKFVELVQEFSGD